MILELKYRDKGKYQNTIVYGLPNSIFTYIVVNDLLEYTSFHDLHIEKKECICTVKDAKTYTNPIDNKPDVYRIRIYLDDDEVIYKIGKYKSILEYLKNMDSIFETAFKLEIYIEKNSEVLK
jgi:hypothetical protein